MIEGLTEGVEEGLIKLAEGLGVCDGVIPTLVLEVNVALVEKVMLGDGEGVLVGVGFEIVPYLPTQK